MTLALTDLEKEIEESHTENGTTYHHGAVDFSKANLKQLQEWERKGYGVEICGVGDELIEFSLHEF